MVFFGCTEENEIMRYSYTIPFPKSSRQCGFTMVELMVVIAILAVLAAIAAPSFQSLIERWRVRLVAEELEGSIYYARSEAIKRGGSVTLEAKGSGWQDGWSIVHTQGANSTTLQEKAASGQVSITLAGSNGKIAVDRWGMMGHSGGLPVLLDFTIVPAGKTASDASAARLCAGLGGRVRRVKGSESCA